MRAAPWVALALAACTHAPQELIDARRAYINAQPTADLTAARFALDRASHEYELNGETEKARDLAYIAQRKIDAANSNARMLEDRRTLARLNVERVKLEAELRREIERQAAALPPAPEAPLTPPPLPPAEPAQPQAPVPLDALASFATVREEVGATVITIPAGLVFAAGEATLTDGAKERLDEVAAVLKSRRGRVDVDVHTDDLGTRADKLSLSAQRAKAVVDYLAGQGVGAERLEAHGAGDTRPLRDNSTPANRAVNRRLEIILKPAPVS
jgi:outer membrane protein OmpA-like peptidoglycan-associated protein